MIQGPDGLSHGLAVPLDYYIRQKFIKEWYGHFKKFYILGHFGFVNFWPIQEFYFLVHSLQKSQFMIFLNSGLLQNKIKRVIILSLITRLFVEQLRLHRVC